MYVIELFKLYWIFVWYKRIDNYVFFDLKVDIFFLIWKKYVCVFDVKVI